MKLLNGHIEKSKDPSETCFFLSTKCNILINTNSPQQLFTCKNELRAMVLEGLPGFSVLLFDQMHRLWTQMSEGAEFLEMVEKLHSKNTADTKCAGFLLDLYFEKGDYLKMNKLIKLIEKASPDPKYKVFSAFLMYLHAKYNSP